MCRIMKRILLVGLLAVACDVIGPGDAGKGELRVSFAQGQESVTRAVSEIPDTGDFILTISDSKGPVSIPEGMTIVRRLSRSRLEVIPSRCFLMNFPSRRLLLLSSVTSSVSRFLPVE